MVWSVFPSHGHHYTGTHSSGLGLVGARLALFDCDVKQLAGYTTPTLPWPVRVLNVGVAPCRTTSQMTFISMPRASVGKGREHKAGGGGGGMSEGGGWSHDECLLLKERRYYAMATDVFPVQRTCCTGCCSSGGHRVIICSVKCFFFRCTKVCVSGHPCTTIYSTSTFPARWTRCKSGVTDNINIYIYIIVGTFSCA